MNDSDSQSKLELKSALNNMFSISYITLTSIIQGAVFALLLTVISDVGFDKQGHCVLTPDQWCLTIVALITIVGVWQEYVIGVTVFNWIPSLLDSLIPFALGFSQIGLCFAVKQGLAWGYESMGVFYLIAVFAFLNMFGQAQSDTRNKFVLDKLGRYSHIVTFTCAFGAVVHLLCFFYAPKTNVFQSYVTSWGVTPLIFGLIQLVRLHFYWTFIGKLAKS